MHNSLITFTVLLSRSTTLVFVVEFPLVMEKRILLVVVCVVSTALVNAINLMVFTSHLLTRDEAQYCCAKYGMSLMSVDDESEQALIVSNFLPLVGNSGAFWLGIFSDDSTQVVYNVKKQPLNFTNWDESSLGPENIGFNGTFVFNSSVCVKGDLSNNFKWKLTSCSERLPYVCELINNDTLNMVDVGYQNVACPVLTKFSTIAVTRAGNIIQNGVTYSGTYGSFWKEDKITRMGIQIGVQVVSNYHDCIILCLNNGQCSEVILVGDQVCLLYRYP